jgi:6-phosphogluconolactonase
MAVDLIRFPTPAELAQAAAERWLTDLGQAKPGDGGYCVALCGGRIFRAFASAVAASAKKRGSTLDQVHFFWSDERCVPSADPESNFSIAQEAIFRPLGVGAKRIHRLKGEDDPVSAAREAEAELRQYAGSVRAGQPVLDLVFLGMGEEGHVASLFPGEAAAIMNSLDVFRPVVAAKPPPHRITMGYPVLAAAHQVWVLASGSGKQDALHESLAPTGQTPLARVLQSRGQTRIFTDI